MNTLIKKTISSIICATLALSTIAQAKEKDVLKPFQGYDAKSEYEISYDDLDLLLDKSVLYAGKSKRIKADKSKGQVGTRFKNKVNRLTEHEGNRFYYEAFKSDERKEYLTNIRNSLEKLPDDAPLNLFTKDEQLAYWLNLYNVTLLDEIIKIYPQRDLEDFITGRKSILDKKLLKVSGIDLSLNDIHNKILKPKYDMNPLIIYGLYQGIVGGPNIRTRAYSGKSVYRELANNADEFINSNRGSYDSGKKGFRVSSLYERNKDYFKNFSDDLRDHMLIYLEGNTRYELENATKIKANIDDWNITDLYGSQRSYGAGINTNSAALQDSATNNLLGRSEERGGGLADATMASSFMVSKTVSMGRFTSEQAERLVQLKKMREQNRTSVTVTDLPSADAATEKKSQ